MKNGLNTDTNRKVGQRLSETNTEVLKFKINGYDKAYLVVFQSAYQSRPRYSGRPHLIHQVGAPREGRPQRVLPSLRHIDKELIRHPS